MSTPFLGSASDHTRQQLRAKRFIRLSRDLYVVAPDSAEIDLRERVTAARLVVPGGIACLWTAGLLTNLPVDDDGAVHLGREREESRSLRDDIEVHRMRIKDDEILELDGLPVTIGPRTMADMSRYVGLERLVAIGDVVVRRYGEAAVQEALARARWRPGVVLLRAAVPLLDPDSASPAETRMRLRLHAAGFVVLRHKVVVRDPGGGWLAEPDLADEIAKVAVQHEGKVHFDKGEGQRVRDLDRDELTRMEGWQVVVSTRIDDARPAQLVAKVSAAYQRAALIWGRHILPPHLR